MNPPRTRVGALIAGRYRIVGEIGRGGMGVVLAATDIRLNRPVAVKLLEIAAKASPHYQQRFLREARVAAGFRHPGVAQVYDFGESNEGPYLVMERLYGISLEQRLEKSAAVTPLDTAVSIVAQLASVLDAAHRRSLVHRDVKPGNVFLESSEHDAVRLLDFGLAFIKDATDSTGRLTADGIISGTPYYMSPEQARGGAEVGPSSDIYGLGCVLYELVAGQPPFDGDTGVVLAKHMFRSPPALRDVSAIAYPNRLQTLLWDMLDKDPERRPSAADVVTALGRIAPNALERLGKGRYGAEGLGREARMISLPPVREEAATIPDGNAPSPRPLPRLTRTIGVLGALDDEVEVALQAVGIRSVDLNNLDADRDVDEIEALVLLSVDGEQVKELASDGVPLLAVADVDDFERVRELLDAGVEEILVSPLRPARIAQQIDRILRTKGRRRHDNHGE